MKTSWKIAPGDNANDWDVFRNNHCIGIGWLPDSDYRVFAHESDALAALENVHGPKAKGNGKGAAKMICEFVDAIGVGDVIIENNAYNEVVGIGVVESDYLPPTARKNPLRTDTNTHRHHVRIVDWLVTRTAYVPGKPPNKHFFVQQTLKGLNDEDVSCVVDAYVNAYPTDKPFAKRLKAIFALSSVPRPSEVLENIDVDMTTSIKGEGRKRLVRHLVRERDRKLVAGKKKSAKSLACEVCGFDSQNVYGVAYCEVHHLTPLADLADGTKTTIKDLAIVCANCHRIMHSKYPPIEIKSLRNMLS
ncbi:HNH endonuclease [Planctomycetes bacterium CA13]|uniref:HNH endonuclease n=1 Tax=Novipirellula herctigrandis TaxID=2527986 RepID=A0A5C5YW84_9BACT|nr:HNH endonuclease [Planctomycetes bacterium CA13]